MQRKGGTSDIRGNDIREIERKKNGGEGMQRGGGGTCGGGSSRQCPNVRLDDLSTYEKIAFYKLVSRKELEGIADEGGRKEAAGKAKGVRKGEVHCGEKERDEDENERRKGRRGGSSSPSLY